MFQFSILRRSRMLLYWLGVFGFVMLIVEMPVAAATLNYITRVWQSADGLPMDNVTAVRQTRDGYIWVVTRSGLARFDGVRFTVFAGTNAPHSGSPHVTSLFEATDGALWIGHEDGAITRFHAGQFAPVPISGTTGWRGGKIFAITADAASEIWLMNQEGELVRVWDGHFISAPATNVTRLVNLAGHPSGEFWVQRGNEVAVLAQGRLRVLPLAEPGGTPYFHGLGVSRDGGIWIFQDARIRKWKDGGWAADLGAAPGGYTPTSVLLETRNGHLAVGTPDHGLYIIVPGERVFHFCRANGFASDWVTALCEDREGNLWVGTGNNGLAMLQTKNVEVLTPPDQWQGRAVLSVTAAADGRLWVGTGGAGLYSYQAGAWKQFTTAEGIASHYVWGTAEDAAGNIWASTWSGELFKQNRDRFEPVPTVEGFSAAIFALLPSSRHGMLVGSKQGLFQYQSNQVTWLARKPELQATDVRAIVETPEGDLWFGMYQWNFNAAASGTTAAPNVGAGGALTLQNSGGTATDLYSAVGEGVSGGAVATSVALHQGSFYEFNYEVTSNLVFGASNLLEVTVRKKSANTSINQAERQADYWTFGGIYRPVSLEARPAEFIERIATDAKADGQIAVHAFFQGLANNYTLAAQVTDTNGTPLGGEFTSPVSAGASNVILAATLPAPQPWSPEFPNLYRLTIQLRDGASVIHSRTETIGFRTLTFTNSVGFFLNGKKIMMRGANRHEFWPTDGRTSSRALSIADIETMKSMNLNAVRMSHYPPAKHFLEECDRLGLLVINELAGWQSPAYDNTIAPGLVREMVIRDVNHPCIFAWANGNEGGFNTTVDDDYGLWDPQNRKVLHPANWESETTGGVRTHHYASYSAVTNYLGAGKPVFMPTEIQHALYDGGGGAGLEDHWNAMRAAPNSAGMFIWALVDECLRRDDQGGALDGAGDQAPDGILGPYREKEASYYTVKALWSPVQITAPNPATFTGALAVENRFDFTSLNQCSFRWQLGWFPDPTDPTNALNAGFLSAVDSGEFAGPAIAPAASGSLNLSLPGNWSGYDALRLIAKDPYGREIYTWTWPLQSAAQIRSRVTSVAASAHSHSD